jgi:hypothetical protein
MTFSASVTDHILGDARRVLLSLVIAAVHRVTFPACTNLGMAPAIPQRCDEALCKPR